MAMRSDLTDFLEKRQALLTPLFEVGDVDKIIEFYDEGLSFSDHAWGAQNLDFSGFEKFLRSTYDTSSSLKMETHGVHGTKEFSVWEWTLRIISGSDDPIRGLVKGKEIVLRGCSLHWWKLQEGKDEADLRSWKIVKEADYACAAGGGH